MRILVIDCCIRREASRTAVLKNEFLKSLRESVKRQLQEILIEELTLMDQELKCLTGDFFAEREQLLADGKRDHPRFGYAHQFAQADKIVIAAPFWDFSIPALLKVYIENITVDGITFGCTEEGLGGLCKASELLFLTTRGNAAGDTPDEQGARYLSALCRMYGIPEFGCISAEGLDIAGADVSGLMERAICEAQDAGVRMAGQ